MDVLRLAFSTRIRVIPLFLDLVLEFHSKQYYKDFHTKLGKSCLKPQLSGSAVLLINK